MATATIRGVDIDHERRGSGPTLIWGHGLTSSRKDEAVPPVLVDWSRAVERLDVVRYDARGHGRSGFTDDPGGYGWDQLALDQLALADHLGIDHYVVGGASMGAATALHAAIAAPERIDALVLAIPPTGWETRAAQTDNYTRMADIVAVRGVEPVVAAGRLIPPPEPFRASEGWHDRSAARLRAADPERLVGVFRGAATADLPAREDVATITAPTLILAWSGDPAHPVATADELGVLLPDVTVEVADTMDQFATWTDRIIEFVNG